MAGQLVLRKQAIQKVAREMSDARLCNAPQGWIDAKAVELRHQVKMFKQVAANALHDHQQEFGANFMSDPKPIDLIEMGY